MSQKDIPLNLNGNPKKTNRLFSKKIMENSSFANRNWTGYNIKHTFWLETWKQPNIFEETV